MFPKSIRILITGADGFIGSHLSEKLILKSNVEVIKGTTILVIAHRLSTIAKADYIYVLGDGKVLEEGTYNSLSIKVTGKLANMLNKEHSN
jgi:ATP-binding cassette subfamily B protein